MIRLPGWKPEVSAIEVAEPARRAGDVAARLVQLRDRLERVLEQLVDVRELGRDALLREVEDDLLGAVDELDRLAGPVEAEPRDVVSGPDQAAERRHLADDARVMGCVRCGRDERRELVDAFGAAGPVERARAVELVDNGDRIDRLALAVQGEDRAEDVPVALAVEVGGREIARLGDRADRERRKHHRAEDGLFGVEILRRDGGGCERLRGRGHAIRSRPGFRVRRKGVERR